MPDLTLRNELPVLEEIKSELETKLDILNTAVSLLLENVGETQEEREVIIKEEITSLQRRLVLEKLRDKIFKRRKQLSRELDNVRMQIVTGSAPELIRELIK